MDFDKFYDVLSTYPSLKSVFSVYDVIISFGLPVLLLIPVAIIYRRTHKGVTYNQVFIHTLFVMSVTTSIIMMIIGSNIARAFSLVGALSIIRFRTAIKDSRDTGYIFAAMAIGMASGTGMYLIAITFAVLYCLLMIGLNFFRVGEKILTDKLLTVTVRESEKDNEVEINKLLAENTNSSSLIHSELTGNDGSMIYSFVVSLSDADKEKNLLHELKVLNSVEKASLFYNDQRIEI